MAGASLLTLLDDIASVLDDVALMTKVAAKKTAWGAGAKRSQGAKSVICWAQAMARKARRPSSLCSPAAAIRVSRVAPVMCS